MCAEYNGGAIRDFIQLLDKYRAFFHQVADHVTIVHDFVADVDRRGEQLQRAFDNLDGAINPGTKTTWISEIYIHE